MPRAKKPEQTEVTRTARASNVANKATNVAKTATSVTKAVNYSDTPDRFRLSEMGYLGLNTFNGVTQDEIKKELNFPNSINTYKQMSYHSTINSAMTLYDNIICKATWEFKPPEQATAEELQQCQQVQQMMHDIEGGWTEFIRDVLSMNVFGFSVHEKVYRRRYHSNGSKYNDGVIGWKKLPIRAQETIDGFVFTEDGNEIKGVKQNLTNVSDAYNRFSLRTANTVVLPRNKFMLFRTGKHRGDPFGKSPLRDAYLAWRFLTSLEDLEATGTAKDINGLPVLTMPPQYLSADATPAQKEVRNYFENAMRNLQMNNQAAMIIPSVVDPETKQVMFKLELLSTDGKKNYDLNKIKEYYKNLIMTSLAADVLILGQSATGSFALGAIKNSFSAAYAESLLQSIVEVLNEDLIRQTYELNGWNTERMGKIDYDNVEPTDLETLSKYYQRVASVGLLEKDREVLNAVRVAVGIDALPADLEPQQDLITPDTSRAGDGFATPGEGTATDVSGEDTSTINLDNNA